MGNWISESMYIDGGMFVPQYADTTWGIATTDTTAKYLNEHMTLDADALRSADYKVDIEVSNEMEEEVIEKPKKEEIQYFPTPKAMREATGREKEVVVKEVIKEVVVRDMEAEKVVRLQAGEIAYLKREMHEREQLRQNDINNRRRDEENERMFKLTGVGGY